MTILPPPPTLEANSYCKNLLHKPQKQSRRILRLALLFVLVFAVFMPGAVAANEYDDYDSSGFGDGGYIGIEPTMAQRHPDATLTFFCYYIQIQLTVGLRTPIFWGYLPPEEGGNTYMGFNVSNSTITSLMPEGWTHMWGRLHLGIHGQPPNDNILHHSSYPAPLRVNGTVYRYIFPDWMIPYANWAQWSHLPAVNLMVRPLPPTLEKESRIISPATLPLQPGDIVEYTLTITNPAVEPWYGTVSPHRRVNWDNMLLEDVLPPGLVIYDGFTPIVNGVRPRTGGTPGYTMDAQGNTLSVILNLPAANQAGHYCAINNITTNGKVTVTFRAIVTDEAPECEFLVNRATLTHLGDPNYVGDPPPIPFVGRPSRPRESVNFPQIYAIDPNPPFVGGDCDEPPPPRHAATISTQSLK